MGVVSATTEFYRRPTSQRRFQLGIDEPALEGITSVWEQLSLSKVDICIHVQAKLTFM